MKQRQRDATFELTVRTDRALFTVIMRLHLPWTVIDYWPDGSIHSSVRCTPEEFLAVCERAAAERRDEG